MALSFYDFSTLNPFGNIHWKEQEKYMQTKRNTFMEMDINLNIIFHIWLVLIVNLAWMQCRKRKKAYYIARKSEKPNNKNNRKFDWNFLKWAAFKPQNYGFLFGL